MITKGIIEEVINNYSVRVRIPTINGLKNSHNSTPNKELDLAYICTLPGVNVYPRIGDIVIVAFEDNDLSKPIILGYLYKENLGETVSGLSTNSITVTGEAVLSSKTSIGDVSPESFKCLQGLNTNVQLELDIIKNKLNKIIKNLGLDI